MRPAKTDNQNSSNTPTTNPSKVLVVDRSTDAIAVLGALLQRRGVETVGAGHARLGLRLAQTVSPDLIILDEDVITREDQTDCVDFVATAERQQVPLLVLGGTLARRNSDSNVQVIAKPYHYSALIRKIEGHLGTSDAA